MTLALAAYLAGVLTILSPCIVPVLPFVLARADRPFLTGTLPLLAGLGAAFVAAAGLAAVGGGWVARLGTAGRVLALCLLAAFAVSLLSPRASSWLHRPLVRLGEILSRPSTGPGRAAGPVGLLGSLCLGAATGLLWTPCAGPILGLALTGAALNGAGWQTMALLTAYASGAATALAGAAWLGGALVARLRPHLGFGEWLRRAAGAALIAVLAAVALGADSDLLARYSAASTTAAEDALLTALRIDPARADPTDGPHRSEWPVEGSLPSLAGATHWLNGAPQTTEGLRGRVVLVHVWTYSCINCIRTLPYLRAWAERYREQGLSVIGIHAPEFAFEHDIGNVAAAIRRFALPYPVAVDNEFRLWRGLRNSYWPALYVVDTQGRIRHHQFGEGGYARSEAAIQALLAESAGGRAPDEGTTRTRAAGVEAAPDLAHLGSSETYLGSDKAANFASPERMSSGPRTYTPGRPGLNEWSLAGAWAVEPEYAHLAAPGGSVTYRFRARDLHLVVGPGPDGQPVGFDVSLDGEPPGEDHGADVGADGAGVVPATRLYQLVRQSGPVRERTFAIRFHRPGVRVYAFTFG
ncbi:cytochrome C biogenesis protein [Methylobacterium variabile]|uniref:Cytochrome C biogenesis protein n=1 Tax=Methylobacterium variabile TaxID=298794 RepID=A0A0J6TA55_9HYPH|nr:cytochrome c biogenesis protein CcdA [Methylobacterium variabile]KMO42769.1 cytochrome C biogenesis protein [Methylobacterium variabile]